jgi:hypothetical protein
MVCRAQSERNQLAVFTVADFTKPSPGEFVSGWNAGTHIVQTNRAGIGQSLEYRRWLWGSNGGSLVYTRTPTDSKLSLPGNAFDIWPITRSEFDLLFTRQLTHLASRRFSPYGQAGAGAIVLNGGKTESGLDRQFAYVAGAGADFKMPWRARLRIGFTTDFLKASTYSDQTYRSSWTAMVSPRIGFVLPIGRPAGD